MAKEGASGTIELPVGELGALKPSRWFPVCSVGEINDHTVKPRTVRVRVGKTAYQDVLYQASLYAGVWWQPESDFVAWIGSDHPYCGVIRFEYGSQGFQRIKLGRPLTKPLLKSWCSAVCGLGWRAW